VDVADFAQAVRIYDLRSHSRYSDGSASPTLTLSTRWSEDAVYSVASAGYRVVAGMARHSILRIADLRRSTTSAGDTLFATARDASPVYSLAMEGSRVFGATRTGAFMLEVGPDVVVRSHDAHALRDARWRREDPWAHLRPRYHLGDDPHVRLRTSKPRRHALLG